MKRTLISVLAALLCFPLQAQNVGIGVPFPTEKLDVAGNIRSNALLLRDSDAILKMALNAATNTTDFYQDDFRFRQMFTGNLVQMLSDTASSDAMFQDWDLGQHRIQYGNIQLEEFLIIPGSQGIQRAVTDGFNVLKVDYSPGSFTESPQVNFNMADLQAEGKGILGGGLLLPFVPMDLEGTAVRMSWSDSSFQVAVQNPDGNGGTTDDSSIEMHSSDGNICMAAAGLIKMDAGAICLTAPVIKLDGHIPSITAGSILGAVKNFRIDHPLDPDKKYLQHSCVEAPERLNVYSGKVTTNKEGLAHVRLPKYFEALNMEFRYQLTTIGSFSRVMIKEEIRENRFLIQSEEPEVEVSWQVTGIRHDKDALENPLVVELDK